jgi:hypothetical protein
MRDEEILHVTQRDDMLIRVRISRTLNYSTFPSESRLTTQESCTTCGLLKPTTSQIKAGNIQTEIIHYFW